MIGTVRQVPDLPARLPDSTLRLVGQVPDLPASLIRNTLRAGRGPAPLR